MREIKFRTWGRFDKRMRYFCLKNVMEGHGDDCPSTSADIDINYVAIMQYTGLKDKNGTEIYEGDILRLGVFPEQEVAPTDSEVEFIGGGFRVEHKDFREEMSENKYGAWVYLDVEDDEGEVVGNIYENPEMVK